MNYRDDFDATLARLDAAELELEQARAKDVVDETRVAELAAALAKTREELKVAKKRLSELEPPPPEPPRPQPPSSPQRSDAEPDPTTATPASPASGLWTTVGIFTFLALFLCVALIIVRARSSNSEDEHTFVPRRPTEVPLPSHTIPQPDPKPHPDYPTPVAAGTDTVFRADESDRGPTVPTTFRVPPRASLVWTTHAYCDVGVIDVACTPGSGFTGWRVGRGGKETLVAEQMRGNRVDHAFVFQAKKDGTPLRRVELDAFGRVVEMHTFKDEDHYWARTPTGANSLLGCGAMGVTIDDKRQVTRRRCLQWNDELMLDKNGVATTKLSTDRHGIVVEKRFLGTDGKPRANRYDTAAIYYDLDRDGRDAVERYRDINDKPVAAIDGCFAWRYEYDARGLMVKETCLDEADHPKLSGSGFAMVSSRYDGRGCLVATRYTDPDGAPATNRDGVHGTNIEADNHCLPLSTTCINLVDQPVACGVASPARIVSAYDQFGRVISSKHYNADGSHGQDSAYRVFERRWEYDEVGNPVRLSCYDAQGNPIECSGTGFHAVVRKFDYAGREIEDRYVDTHNAPTTNLGTTFERSAYDSYDHWSESTDYDADGKVLESLGMATRRELYDESHRRFAVLLFDRDGKPARYTGCFPGESCPQQAWHAVRLVRDAHGYVVTNLFFDAERQLIETHDCSTQQCFE